MKKNCDKKIIDNEENDNHNENNKGLFVSFILISMVILRNIYQQNPKKLCSFVIERPKNTCV